MAVKKTAANKAAEAVETEIVDKIEIVETESPADKKATAKPTSTKEPAGDADGFCVYIGPSIRGVIQSGTVYGKSLKETKEFLKAAIEKYPLIGKLISTEKTIAEDRIKVKTAGNLLSVHYAKLASGKSN